MNKKSTGGPPAHKGQQAVGVSRFQQADGPQPCDTSSSAFRPRAVQEHVGYTLDMAVTGSLEPHQAVVHHGTANEVVVAGTLNSEM